MVEPKPISPVAAELSDRWVFDGKHVRNDGDAAKIDALLSNDLIKVATSDGGWTRLYKHRATGTFWELSYPQSEMHGGGPRRLRELSIDTVEQWLP